MEATLEKRARIKQDMARLQNELDAADASGPNWKLPKGTTIVQQLQCAMERIEFLDSELAAARRGLANPAFAAAAVVGSKKPVEEGHSVAAGASMTKQEALAAYRQLTDPKSRENFRKAHAEVLGLSR